MLIDLICNAELCFGHRLMLITGLVRSAACTGGKRV